MTTFREDMDAYMERHDHRHNAVQAYLRHAYIVGAAAGMRAALRNETEKVADINELLFELARDGEL